VKSVETGNPPGGTLRLLGARPISRAEKKPKKKRKREKGEEKKTVGWRDRSSRSINHIKRYPSKDKEPRERLGVKVRESSEGPSALVKVGYHILSGKHQLITGQGIGTYPPQSNLRRGLETKRKEERMESRSMRKWKGKDK